MDVFALVLMFTVLLQEKTTSGINYFFSSTELSLSEAIEFCQNNHGYITLFDSQDTWNTYVSEMNSLNKCGTRYWASNVLDSCLNGNNGRWHYSGWGIWDGDHEPDECPNSACVTVTCSGMRTRKCTGVYFALCRKDLSTTVQTTSSADDRTTEQTTASTNDRTTAQTTASVNDRTTEQTTASTNDRTTAQTTVSVNDRTTTQTTASFHDRTTAQTTSSANDRTTQQLTSSANDHTTAQTTASTNDGKSTSQNTHTAVFTSDVSTTTQVTTMDYVSKINCSMCCAKSSSRQLDQGELDNVIQELKIQLAVNKTNLSIYRRRLISVYDPRPSSVAVGGVAIAILAIITSTFIIIDLAGLFRCHCRIR